MSFGVVTFDRASQWRSTCHIVDCDRSWPLTIHVMEVNHEQVG